MRRRLPPLNALRAFEAAARHLSFTKGAAELYVTQAAVSHQVKALEEHLGVRLFKRLDRALALTREGEALFVVVRDAFDRLDQAAARLMGGGGERETLVVTSLPSFAARWLVPRLGRFGRAYPHIDVRLEPSIELADFERDQVDVAIRYGRGHYPGLSSEWLLDEELFPVCSPALLEGPKPLRAPEDLRHHTLLHAESEDWEMWLRPMGVEGVDAARGPVFQDSSMLLQAAVAGQGVALGRSVLAAEDLAAGRLVRPFSLSQPAGYAYYLVYPARAAETPKVKAFREWALQETRLREP